MGPGAKIPFRRVSKLGETGTPSGKQPAMLKWWIAAERGLETGQSNLALILDQGKFGCATCVRRLLEGLLSNMSDSSFFPSMTRQGSLSLSMATIRHTEQY